MSAGQKSVNEGMRSMQGPLKLEIEFPFFDYSAGENGVKFAAYNVSDTDAFQR